MSDPRVAPLYDHIEKLEKRNRDLEQRLAAAERDAERWQALVDLWALGTLTLELNGGFYEAHIEVPGEGASVCIGSAEEIIDSSRGEWDAALKERQ